MTEGVLALSMDTWQKIEPFYLAAHALILVLLITCLFLASKYFLHAKREQKLIRIERFTGEDKKGSEDVKQHLSFFCSRVDTRYSCFFRHTNCPYRCIPAIASAE